MVDYSKWKDIDVSSEDEDRLESAETFIRHAKLSKKLKQKRELDALKQKKFKIQKYLYHMDPNLLRESTDERVELVHELERIDIQVMTIQNELIEDLDASSVQMNQTNENGQKVFDIEFDKNWDSIREISNGPQEEQLKVFISKHESLCKQYGIIKRYDESKNFLHTHPYLICDATARYLVLWAAHLDALGYNEMAYHVAHQCVCMQNIVESMEKWKSNPSACVELYFKRIQYCSSDYQVQFYDELQSLIKLIKERARNKSMKMLVNSSFAQKALTKNAQMTETYILDPKLVFKALPKKMRICFAKRSLVKLEKIVAKMHVDEALFHLKRCIDSGLWVPSRNRPPSRVFSVATLCLNTEWDEPMEYQQDYFPFDVSEGVALCVNTLKSYEVVFNEVELPTMINVQMYEESEEKDNDVQIYEESEEGESEIMRSSSLLQSMSIEADADIENDDYEIEEQAFEYDERMANEQNEFNDSSMDFNREELELIESCTDWMPLNAVHMNLDQDLIDEYFEEFNESTNTQNEIEQQTGTSQLETVENAEKQNNHVCNKTECTEFKDEVIKELDVDDTVQFDMQQVESHVDMLLKATQKNKNESDVMEKIDDCSKTDTNEYELHDSNNLNDFTVSAVSGTSDVQTDSTNNVTFDITEYELQSDVSSALINDVQEKVKHVATSVLKQKQLAKLSTVNNNTELQTAKDDLVDDENDPKHDINEDIVSKRNSNLNEHQLKLN